MLGAAAVGGVDCIEPYGVRFVAANGWTGIATVPKAIMPVQAAVALTLPAAAAAVPPHPGRTAATPGAGSSISGGGVPRPPAAQGEVIHADHPRDRLLRQRQAPQTAQRGGAGNGHGQQTGEAGGRPAA